MATASSKIVKVNDIMSVDETHNLVVGMAIVCKVLNEATGVFEDYYDLNVDAEGVHKGQRVPENITESAVFKALIEAGEAGIMPGNEQHAGPDVGKYVGLFVVTEDIAKSMDWTIKKTGLAVQYHAPDDVIAKFKDGTYTGFSIEGARVEFEEVADA